MILSHHQPRLLASSVMLSTVTIHWAQSLLCEVLKLEMESVLQSFIHGPTMNTVCHGTSGTMCDWLGSFHARWNLGWGCWLEYMGWWLEGNSQQSEPVRCIDYFLRSPVTAKHSVNAGTSGVTYILFAPLMMKGRRQWRNSTSLSAGMSGMTYMLPAPSWKAVQLIETRQRRNPAGS